VALQDAVELVVRLVALNKDYLSLPEKLDFERFAEIKNAILGLPVVLLEMENVAELCDLCEPVENVLRIRYRTESYLRVLLRFFFLIKNLHQLIFQQVFDPLPESHHPLKMR
jgi:hypothetical protein